MCHQIKIHFFYMVRKEASTIKKLLTGLKEDEVIDCRWEYLWQIIRNLGFQWKRCQSKCKLLIERPVTAAWRMCYQQNIHKYRVEGRNIVYIDKTYSHIHEGLSVEKCWQSSEEIGELKKHRERQQTCYRSCWRRAGLCRWGFINF